MFRIFLSLLAVGLMGVSNLLPVSRASEKLQVIVTIPPLVDLVERIAGDLVDVIVMVEPGSNVHTYEPTIFQLKKISHADLYIALGSGVEFELVWMDKIKAFNRGMKICHAAERIHRLEVQKSSDTEPPVMMEHDHGGEDPHVWLSPYNVVLMIDPILEALVALDSEHKEQYEKKAQETKDLFDSLDQDLQEFFSQRRNKVFMVVHPAWTHFEERYHLQQISVFHEGKEPSFKQLRSYVDMARDKEISFIFASPYINQKIARVIAGEIQGSVVALDPLEKDLYNNFQYIKNVFKDH